MGVEATPSNSLNMPNRRNKLPQKHDIIPDLYLDAVSDRFPRMTSPASVDICSRKMNAVKRRWKEEAFYSLRRRRRRPHRSPVRFPSVFRLTRGNPAELCRLTYHR